MSVLVLAGVYADELLGAEIAFDAGLHVVLGRVSDGTASLVATISGLARARRGKVRLNDDDPWRAPALRAGIGTLLASEPPPSRTSVTAWITDALALHGVTGATTRLLADAGLARMATRRTDQLRPAERRAVALAIALEIPRPRLLALHEPLADVAGVDRRWTLARLSERAGGGACIVCTTASPRDAAELGGGLTLLDRGRFVRRPGTPLSQELAPGLATELRIRAPRPAELAAVLATEPAVTGVRFDHDEHPGELRVRGPNAAALARSVVRAARGAGAPVVGIEPVLPSLDEARAASVALWRAAYERAYRAASVRPEDQQPKPPAPSASASPEVPPTDGTPPSTDGAAS